MKTKFAILIVALLSVCMLIRPSAMAIGISIEVGDRPYYSDGPSYWDGGYEWVFVAGHWGPHHEWIHGHYVRRGEFHREHAREHHHHHHDGDERH
jgi:hypothetical protein